LGFVRVQVLLSSGFSFFLGAAFCSGSMLQVGFIAVVAFLLFVWPVAAGYGSVFGGG
jgi:hypothetical protein